MCQKIPKQKLLRGPRTNNQFSQLEVWGLWDVMSYELWSSCNPNDPDILLRKLWAAMCSSWFPWNLGPFLGGFLDTKLYLLGMVASCDVQTTGTFLTFRFYRTCCHVWTSCRNVGTFLNTLEFARAWNFSSTDFVWRPQPKITGFYRTFGNDIKRISAELAEICSRNSRNILSFHLPTLSKWLSTSCDLPSGPGVYRCFTYSVFIISHAP